LKDEKEKHVLLKIFNKILSSSVDKNQNFLLEHKNKFLKRVMDEIVNNPEFDSSKDIVNQVSKNERLIRPLLDIVSENNVPKKEIKVLEINSSNAINAIDVDNYLASAAIYPIVVDYTLVNNSIENLSEDLKNKSFKLIQWNSNESTFPQDIQSVDLLVYRDSYDLWNLKLDIFLQRVYQIVKDNGFLVTIFRYTFTSPELVLNELCGQKNINDSDLTKRINEFRIEAQKTGLNIICNKSDSIGSIAILFRKVQPIKDLKPKEENMIEISADYEKWFEILKEKLSKVKENDEKNEKLWLIANDSSINGIIGLTLCLRQEPGGDRIRCIFDYDTNLKLAINFSEDVFSKILTNDLAVNVIRDRKLGSYRHLSLTKSDQMIETTDYYLNIEQRGDLSSLQWYDSKNVFAIRPTNDQNSLIANQIRCKVYCSGLNFRDVMMASGNYIRFMSCRRLSHIKYSHRT